MYSGEVFGTPAPTHSPILGSNSPSKFSTRRKKGEKPEKNLKWIDFYVNMYLVRLFTQLQLHLKFKRIF